MSRDPLTIIAEVLGEPADQMRNPVNAGYQCPFINSVCTKRSQRMQGSYPVCSIYRKGIQHCVCPKRFYQADLVADVLAHCWPGTPPTAPQIAYEVQMKGFGMVDLVIAELDDANAVRAFVSVELQAVDITGSVEPAYQSLLGNAQVEGKISYGLNWANVRKRYVSQLISKGFYHHHWGSKIVSVLQEPLYAQFRHYIPFDELDPKSATSNVVFMLYDFQDDAERGAPHRRLAFTRAIGTSHNSLMTGALYRTPPDRAVFCQRILERLNRE
ncbi:MAG: hypothetical protein EDM82_05875 [Cyanobacteria bacterium CYA]|nr:MAG: hypothetical protein EDM82_05875 [Cyanobacteria bacterium CYA]